MPRSKKTPRKHAAKRSRTRTRGVRAGLVQSTFNGRRAVQAPRGSLNTYCFQMTLPAQYIVPGATAYSVDLGSGGVNPSPNTPISLVETLNTGGTSSLGANYLDISFATSHALNDCFNFASFANMFDAWRLDSVTAVIEYLVNSSSIGVTPAMPTVYMYNDQDDALFPTSIRQIAAKQGVVIWQPSATDTVKAFTYKPRCAISAVVGTGDTGPALVASPGKWVNCTYASAKHYAGKFAISDWYSPGSTAFPSSRNGAFRITWKYNISFRGPLLCS